jgi:hypothetical protein
VLCRSTCMTPTTPALSGARYETLSLLWTLHFFWLLLLPMTLFDLLVKLLFLVQMFQMSQSTLCLHSISMSSVCLHFWGILINYGVIYGLGLNS